jgi:hypothetical protein
MRGKAEAVLPILALSMMAMLGACAKTEQVAMQAAPAPSALPNPGLLQKGQSGQFDRVYLDPNAKWGSYTKILLEPVTIWSGPGSDMDKASPQTQKGPRRLALHRPPQRLLETLSDGH